MLLTTMGDIEEKLLPEQEASILLIAQKETMEYLPVLESL